jgi:hypothetical protein
LEKEKKPCLPITNLNGLPGRPRRRDAKVSHLCRLVCRRPTYPL